MGGTTAGGPGPTGSTALEEIIAWSEMAEEWINSSPMAKQNHQFAPLLMQTVRRIRALALQMEELKRGR